MVFINRNKKNIKDVVRIGVKGHESGDGFYHLECFSENKIELGFKFKIEE